MSRIYGEPKKLKSEIILTRPQGGGKERVVFQIVDKISGLVAFRIEMSIPEFGEMLSSPQNVPCIVKHFQSDNIGKKYEHKSELVPRPEIGVEDKDKVLEELLKPFEIDGWIGSRDDLTNHHNWVSDNKSKVTFVRWVDVDESQKI